MSEHPKLNPTDWIKVGNIDCVVTCVYPQNSSSLICLVVFDKTKPTTHDVDWDGEKWIFPKRPDFGGYINDTDKYVLQLKRGKKEGVKCR